MQIRTLRTRSEIDIQRSSTPYSDTAKEMYPTRLRTLMDEILATSFIDEYVRRTPQKIRKDALRDSKKVVGGRCAGNRPGRDDLLSQVVPKPRESRCSTSTRT